MELPFFKFIPSEWIAGNITLCSMRAQGLFINLCAWYWKKECTLTLSQAIERFPDMDGLFEELTDNDLIIMTNQFVRIKFLDRQFRSFKRNKSTEKLPTMRRTVPAVRAHTHLRGKNKEKQIKNFTKRREIIPPKLEWVVEYCEKRKKEGKPPIDPEQFFNNYKAKGWLISGGVKMKNWEAAVRYWEGNQKQRVNKPQNTVGSRQGSTGKKQYRKPDMEI